MLKKVIFYFLSLILLVIWIIGLQNGLAPAIHILVVMAIISAFLGKIYVRQNNEINYDITEMDAPPAHASIIRNCKYLKTTLNFTKLSGTISTINLITNNGKLINDGFYLEHNGHTMYNLACIPPGEFNVRIGDTLILYQKKAIINTITINFDSIHTH